MPAEFDLVRLERRCPAIGKLSLLVFPGGLQGLRESQPELGHSRIRCERIEVEPCGSLPLSALEGAVGNRLRRRGAGLAKKASEASTPMHPSWLYMSSDLLCPHQDCGVEPPGAFLRERVPLGTEVGKLVMSGP